MLTLTELLEHYHVVRQTFAPLRLTRWQLTKLFAAQIWSEATTLVKVVIFTVGALILSAIVARLTRPRSLGRLGIPRALIPKASRLDFEKILEDTFAKDPESPFLLSAYGNEYVVFPSRCFDEVKKLPEIKASAFSYFFQVFHGAWTGAGVQSPVLVKTVAVDLNRAIPSLVRMRQKDCAVACDTAIGSSAEWKGITVYAVMQELVASVNASAFVGRDLGTNHKWLQAVGRIPMLLAIPTIMLSYLPALLQPVAKPLLFAPLMWAQWSVRKMLRPVVEADVREYQACADKKNVPGPKEQGKVQLTAWLLARYKSEGGQKVVMDQLIQDYMSIFLESTASSALTLFFVVCELAANPALQKVLREELEETTSGGQLPQSHLNELKKMDSVMRESSRLNGFSALVLCRKLLAPIKLSLGPELPKGTMICVDAHHINYSSELWHNPAPDVFDGLRHYRARQIPHNENRFKFANLGSDAPGWGDGPQACPGRMFADNTIKIVLTHLLLNYEFKLRPGEGKPKKGSMPNGSTLPDLKAKILLRSRTKYNQNGV